jgi:PadR family transcriptional regulator, regulatory protein PadR
MDNQDMDIKLGELEASLLYSIIHCGNDAYGVSINDTLKERTGDDVAMGAIYATLDRLERKGLVRSWWSEPGPGRGGRRKRLFEVTGVGQSALHEYDQRFLNLREGWLPVVQEAR